jgi:hypothetical protein
LPLSLQPPGPHSTAHEKPRRCRRGRVARFGSCKPRRKAVAQKRSVCGRGSAPNVTGGELAISCSSGARKGLATTLYNACMTKVANTSGVIPLRKTDEHLSRNV